MLRNISSLKIRRPYLVIALAAAVVFATVFSLLVSLRTSRSFYDERQKPGPGVVVQPRQSTPLQLPGQHKPTPTPKPRPTAVPTQPGSPQTGPQTGPQTIQPSTPGTPTLERLEQVTDQAFGSDGQYVPNSWGTHKSRIIRTSTGDLFTVFISQGSDLRNRTWHLMHRPTSGGWQEIKSGNAGTEPINILRGIHDEIHLFAWPGTASELHHFVSTDLGQTFSEQVIPGQWSSDQGYTGVGTNTQGDIALFQTGDDQPGLLYWAYCSHTSGQWQFHISTLDQFRHTYAYIFPDDHNNLNIAAVRDVQRPLLGYPSASGFNYIFNAIRYFSISDVNNPTVTSKLVAQVQPQSNEDADITYLTDSYIDTQGRMHILYYQQYDQTVHHIILDHGQVIKEVQQDISYGPKARIIQDTLGHFYIISMDQSGNSINVYPGSASDTDGTQLNQPVQLNISKFPGCTDYDFCHSPTFTNPRNGHALADYIDGTYGNFTNEFYFRIRLRGQAAIVPTTSGTAYAVSFPPLSLGAVDERRRQLGDA